MDASERRDYGQVLAADIQGGDGHFPGHAGGVDGCVVLGGEDATENEEAGPRGRVLMMAGG